MSVSTSRVMEYDPFSQEFQADPFPVYRWMRDEAPVFYSEKWNWAMSVEQIQALADGLATRIGRAVLVDDRELRLVAASEDFGDADPARAR